MGVGIIATAGQSQADSLHFPGASEFFVYLWKNRPQNPIE